MSNNNTIMAVRDLMTEEGLFTKNQNASNNTIHQNARLKADVIKRIQNKEQYPNLKNRNFVEIDTDEFKKYVVSDYKSTYRAIIAFTQINPKNRRAVVMGWYNAKKEAYSSWQKVASFSYLTQKIGKTPREALFIIENSPKDKNSAAYQFRNNNMKIDEDFLNKSPEGKNLLDEKNEHDFVKNITSALMSYRPNYYREVLVNNPLVEYDFKSDCMAVNSKTSYKDIARDRKKILAENKDLEDYKNYKGLVLNNTTKDKEMRIIFDGEKKENSKTSYAVFLGFVNDESIAVNTDNGHQIVKLIGTNVKDYFGKVKSKIIPIDNNKIYISHAKTTRYGALIYSIGDFDPAEKENKKAAEKQKNALGFDRD